ncbi:hypothetical protein [Dichotomicrobium thermohalophilum]|uniref:Uncharacterized protein n=1 Tax=Dichotomicrobium thermohalophilum TaxID=933063 RepID=A0A397P7A7_9HYPH|nr:hypothetical protein [Dichotomicrobium thermohalophilum]RIA45436.1 hypothetical protein BXY53_2723 [Dichotomicrobium thermohalophilum]
MRRIATASIALALTATAASAQSDEAKIKEALSAAPPQLRDEVTVRDLDGTLLRQGESNYVCMPGPQGFAGPMCLDEPWRQWFEAYQNQKDFTPERIGISYMLAGDAPGGGASNSAPYDKKPTPNNDWVVEGPHVMIIVPDDSILEGLPVTPDTNGPYVMWPGTPYAHIMLPVDQRPEQRPVK